MTEQMDGWMGGLMNESSNAHVTEPFFHKHMSTYYGSVKIGLANPKPNAMRKPGPRTRFAMRDAG